MITQHDILDRIIAPQSGGFSEEHARYVLSLDFTPDEHARYEDLAAKAQAGSLTPEEQSEIDEFLAMNAMLALLQSKARVSLSHWHSPRGRLLRRARCLAGRTTVRRGDPPRLNRRSRFANIARSFSVRPEGGASQPTCGNSALVGSGTATAGNGQKRRAARRPVVAKPTSRLGETSIVVLEMIAAGNTYDQILAAHPHLTYPDIFTAAQEALDSLAAPEANVPVRVSEVRKTYARAYEKWTPAEEQRLRQMIDNGMTVAQMAGRLQRQRSAIRSRIIRLNLVSALSPKEQIRLMRMTSLDTSNADRAAQ